MMYLPHRRKHFRASGGGATYTEVAPIIITPTGTVSQWNDYDIYTNNGIPKGAVAEIIAVNIDSTATEAGVRTDGSALSTRYKDMDGYYSNAGYMTLRFITTVHATTGLIELWSENNSNIRFMVVGYWEGVTWTERFDTITVDGDTENQWSDINVNTLFSTPVSRVYDFMVVDDGTNASHILGARANGSILERKLEQSGVYQGGASGWNFCTQVDSSGIFEVYLEVDTSDVCYSMGYFDDTVSFTEAWTDITPTADSTWQDKTLSLPTGALHSEIFLAQTIGGETIGCRQNGLSLVRYYVQGAGGSITVSTNCGNPMFCNFDVTDKIEVFSSNYARADFRYSGSLIQV